MPGESVAILSAGGLRSLVAAGLELSKPGPPRVTFIHVLDDRPTGQASRERVLKQAQHFQQPRVVELAMAHPESAASAGGTRLADAPLGRTRLLLAGLAAAVETSAVRLIWPAQVNAEHEQAARLTELSVLVGHLAQLEIPEPPAIDTPLLELTDQQLIELGGQLDVPWELAWSCGQAGETPCGACAGCLRRRKAFDAAGVVDPLGAPTP